MIILIGSVFVYGMLTYILLKLPSECAEVDVYGASGTGSHHQ